MATRNIFVFYATKLYQDWTMPKDISDLSIRKKKVLGLATFVVKLIRIIWHWTIILGKYMEFIKLFFIDLK